MSKVISPIMTDGTGMAIAQAINHNTATQLALNTNSYDESETLLEVQDARTINETQYASLGEGIRAEVTRINGELGVVNEVLETHTNNIAEVTDKANQNTTDIATLNDKLNKNHQISIFKNLSEIGINSNDEIVDITTIMNKLPNPSILEMGINNSDRELFCERGVIPVNANGTIRIVNVGRVRVEFYKESGSFYIKTATNRNMPAENYSSWYLYAGTEVK